LNFNGLRTSSSSNVNNLEFFNFFRKNKNTDSNLIQFKIIQLFTTDYLSKFVLSKFFYFSTLNETFNDDSDKKKIMYPLFKITNVFKNKLNLIDNSNISKFPFTQDVENIIIENQNTFFKNKNNSYKFFSTFSANQSILTGSKSLRNFADISINNSQLNHDFFLNNFTTFQFYTNRSSGFDNSYFYN
jgi:hypothetical protein